MRLKNLFTVPEDQKMTEKIFRRVLISSICSILLCVSCLFGTTWALFKVELENKGNVIRIGEPEVRVTINDAVLEHSTQLSPEYYTVLIEHANEPDDLNRKSTLYVTLMITTDSGTRAVYTTLNHENEYTSGVNVDADVSFTLGWEVSWFAPVNAIELIDDTIYLEVEVPAETEISIEETTPSDPEDAVAP